jgi:Leucine-rich repeat (LRR) protein
MDALSLHKNCLASIPSSLSLLTDLSRLSLYENELEAVPAGIGELQKVQEMCVLLMHGSGLGELQTF